MCLKGKVSCPVSCTELSKIRYTTKTMLQMNTISRPGQTHSALSDAVVILTSFLFHHGILHSYVHINVRKERADRERLLFHWTVGWWFSNKAYINDKTKYLYLCAPLFFNFRNYLSDFKKIYFRICPAARLQFNSNPVLRKN
jgi:hypothetical protein